MNNLEFTAYNIVNQLFDAAFEAYKPEDTIEDAVQRRQNLNDNSREWVKRMIERYIREHPYEVFRIMETGISPRGI